MTFKRLTFFSLILSLLAALGLIALTACGSQTGSITKDTSVTFLGNSGFLVMLGDKKVLIDGIFAGFPNGYTQPQELIDRISRAEPPFDGIDLILATHAHDDHFDFMRVAEYLEISPQTAFYSTEDAAGQVIDWRPALERRVTGIPYHSGESHEYQVAGMRLVAYSLSHGYDANGNEFPNEGFLVEANGVKIFHSGDMDTDSVTVDYLELLGLPEERVDIAFLPHFLFRNIGYLPLAIDGVSARFYVPIHYAYTTPSFNALMIQQVYPDAILFDEETDTWVMPETPKPAATR